MVSTLKSMMCYLCVNQAQHLKHSLWFSTISRGHRQKGMADHLNNQDVFLQRSIISLTTQQHPIWMFMKPDVLKSKACSSVLRHQNLVQLYLMDTVLHDEIKVVVEVFFKNGITICRLVIIYTNIYSSRSMNIFRL